MIISASRRTDIPAFYAQWFINRLKAGYVLVPSPYDCRRLSRVCLDPEQVECIVFWTKNPLPLLKKIAEIDGLGFKYYFQFTLTSYDRAIERNLPRKKTIIDIFKELSDKIGSNKIVWRYDPILLTDKYNIDYHDKWFRYLAENLSGYTNSCVMSFIDMYKKCRINLRDVALEPITDDIRRQVAARLSRSARDFGIRLESCAQAQALSDVGVTPGKCIDNHLIEKIRGDQLVVEKDKSQRPECRCVASVDIGSYDTCRHYCKYCYANRDVKAVENNCKKHDATSPLLVGGLSGEEKITVREMKSLRSKQKRLF